MRKRYWFVGIRVAVVAALLAVTCSDSWAQLGEKTLPTLSLQKRNATNTTNGEVLNSGTIYVAEPGQNEKRFLVLPIFIHNCLDSITGENPVGHPGERIFSFKFDLEYNRTLLKAVGVSKRGALPVDTFVLAKNFNLSWNVEQEPNYKLSTTGGPSNNGERISVTGSSSLPLARTEKRNPFEPNPTCEDRDTMVFVYVLFEVVGDASGGVSGATADQLILVRESIQWNNFRPAAVSQEMLNRGFGAVQAGVAPTPIFPITYPNNYGSAIVQITRRPRIDLRPPADVVQVPAGDFTNYELVRPMQTQFGNPNRIWQNLILVNGIAGSFLRDLVVETDAPWLRIDTADPTVPPGVGDGGYVGERGVVIRRIGPQLNFNLVANPTLLPAPPNGYPKPGIYEAYVTIRSIDAQNSAVRLRVQLIVNRNPLEPSLRDSEEPTQPRGILMTFRNSAALVDTTYLTMGTGVAATDSVDRLFGELEATTPPGSFNGFYARFYPPSLDGTGFNGLIDGRGLYTRPTSSPMSTNGEASLDIRNFDVETIHTYCVNFDAGAPQNYPVVLEYDLLDLPAGSQLFFRQNVAGVPQVLNMRTEGANVGGTRRAVFIADPNVKSFCIDYLLPRVVQFPEINRGWNFVSLPVDPSDPRAESVFPNSTSGAISFAQNVYSKVDTVRAGIGYFVKYASILDTTVSGVPVMEINELRTPIRVRLFEGWNTVGALSVATIADKDDVFPGVGIEFGSYQGRSVPAINGEIYRYLTSRGYEQASRIVPGYGYWLKVTGDGWYQLYQQPAKFAPGAAETTKPYQALNNLHIADNGQHSSSQLWFGYGNVSGNYEMPPVLGDEFFDVRFASTNGFVSASSNKDVEHVVNLTGVEYPVVLSVENVDANYLVQDAKTGAYIGEFKAGEATAVRIDNPLTKSVKLTRVASSSIELSAAYPNPVTDKLTFDFAVPGESHVSIGLYNSLGEKVADLFSGPATDRQTVEFPTKGLNTGLYLYKMTTASGETEVRHVVIAR